eukprot:TRINITY_DN30291_c0_g1_i1.p1 TRINITY_DN30291_c0_g1~~TRINITY_DN30291_c0_g1_i1.p1  ORF type:complete len:412 (-),score=60.25 TRINITY_DN30291_c0_g1_i1:405-1640(-)
MIWRPASVLDTKSERCMSICLPAVEAQMLPPGTLDVPVPREGVCDKGGPAVYTNRLSQMKPNLHFEKICPKLGGAEIRFNDPCLWAHGKAQLTAAHFTNMCKGATRMAHWHSTADEWAYVKSGRVYAYVVSPEGLPWPSSNNVIGPGGVWYFPENYIHGLMCMTPEEEGGCELTLVFASPVPAEPNGHNLDTTLDQASAKVAAAMMGIPEAKYGDIHPAFHGAGIKETSLITQVDLSFCEPECPTLPETLAAPAAQEALTTEKIVQGGPGVVLRQVRTTQFPFARTMSQERAQLQPGATRPLAWFSADALLMVTSGSINISLQGGILGSEAHKAYEDEGLKVGDIAYIPNGRAVWFKEATGKEPAETIMVFNVGEWKTFDGHQQLSLLPSLIVQSNLHEEQTKPDYVTLYA